MTAGAQRFVTPLAAGALSGERVHTDLFDREAEADIGHIRLARDADAVVVAPATANLMSKMAAGAADDLASTVLLATTLPILIAPAMNVRMWGHPATERNLATLRRDGVHVVGPNEGAMAEAEFGPGPHGRAARDRGCSGTAARRIPLPPRERRGEGAPARRQARPRHVRPDARADRSGALHREPLLGPAGSCHRGRRRRGRRDRNARVRTRGDPRSARGRRGARRDRARDAGGRRGGVAGGHRGVRGRGGGLADRRRGGAETEERRAAIPPLALVENPDILAAVAHRSESRPPLVVGFAAETERVVEHARAKLARKGCDLIVANDVSPGSGVMGGTRNAVHLVSTRGVETWPVLDKDEVARRLVTRLSELSQASPRD
jgi:phosphopantothenoylcysteine decarboxylase/phosphopantothenate--cysteine ligase